MFGGKSQNGLVGFFSLIFLAGFVSAATEKSHEIIFQRARLLFYTAVNDAKQIAPAIALFDSVAQMEPGWQGRAATYRGALIALKGKHALLPIDKYKWTKRGLTVMDQGLALQPDDIESLFIHGSTCYYLPFFFKRKEMAERNLKKILYLTPDFHLNYDRLLVRHAIRFIIEKIPLSDSEKMAVHRITSLGILDEL
jgi:hypothetical protein